MIIDDVKINVVAGNGGSGLAVFSKTKRTFGPTGGSGGKGGSIFLEGVSDLGALRQFRFKKVCQAKNGQNGKSQLNDGADAENLILFVPVGTVARIGNEKEIEITKIGQQELIAKGGRGGKGNYLFRSATNTSPRQFEQGKPGESFEVRLELKMIADIGLIGLPNVGKSNLLNELTNANSKVANYPFTTLEPNLGVYYELILADIPGLIEGASQGKGLGIKFLRHIERTKVLFHLVDAESLDPVHDYKTVREEMKIHNPLLLKKDEYVFLSKSDNVSKDEVKKKVMLLKPLNKHVYSLSLLEPKTVEKVKDILNK